jgi:transcriptional antiterminator RfaH
MLSTIERLPGPLVRTTMQRWYLIQTKPSGEMAAEVNLRRQGYELYFPRAIKAERRRGRLREQIVALFPRYLFLRLDEGRQPLTPVNSTTGVAGVVRFGSRYALVPDCVIHDLRAREDVVTGLHRLVRPAALTTGMPVQISMGPFDGLEGVFERAAGADRVVVLLKLLGQTARVHVPMASVAPASAAA